MAALNDCVCQHVGYCDGSCQHPEPVSATTSAGVTEEQTLRVKQLEWAKSHMTPWDGDYHTVPTGYTVRCADENGWKWQGLGGFGYARSPDAAMAMAQADHERHVLSSLETSRVDAPVSQKEAVPVGYVTQDVIAELAAGNIGGYIFPKGTLRPENEIALYASPAPAGEPGTKATAESIARIISQSYGEDPDGLAPRARICGPKNERLPNWMVYEEQANAIRSALVHPTPVSAPVGESKVRYSRVFGNDRMEMGRSLPIELYRIGDTILVWANEGDLCFYGQEFARSPAVEGK